MAKQEELQGIKQHLHQDTLKVHELLEVLETCKDEIEVATAFYTLGYIRASKRRYPKLKAKKA